MLDKSENCGIIYLVPYAGIAHPVERHLAKVEVASSSLVARSNKKTFVFLTKVLFLQALTEYEKRQVFAETCLFGRSGET